MTELLIISTIIGIITGVIATSYLALKTRFYKSNKTI